MGRRNRWIYVAFATLATAVVVAWLSRRDAEMPDSRSAAGANFLAVSSVGAARARHGPRTKPTTETPPAVDAAPGDDKPKPVLLRFRVTTQADKPIAGARIAVKCDDGKPIQLVTDETGAARMPEAVATRDVDVVVHARGFVVDDLRPEFDEKNDEVVVKLEPGVDVVGRVLDGPSGRPVADAHLETFRANSDDDTVLAAATTDAEGAFRLEDVYADRTYIVVRAEGHVGASFEIDENDVGPIDVRLDPGGRVVGVARDADGSPVAGVHVVATSPSSMAGDGYLDATTDSEGRFALDGLRFDVEYGVEARNYPYLATARAVVTASAPEVVVELAPTGPPRTSLTVVVTSAGADPPHNIRLLLCRDSDVNVKPQTLDETRTATFAEIPPGLVHVHAWADDRAAATADVDVVEDFPKRVEIALDGDLTISGVVVDDVGKPLGWVSVGSDERVGCSDAERAVAIADGDGQFSLHVAVPGKHKLDVQSADHAAGYAEVEPGAAPVRIALSRMTTARLRLRLAGLPMDNYYVACEWLDDGGQRLATDSDWHGPGSLDLTVAAPTTAHHLGIHVDGFVPIRLDVHPVFGETLDLGEIALDTGASLVVRVIDAEGHAVAAPWVSVKTADESENDLGDATSRPDGTFEAHGFAPGPVFLEVAAAAFLPTKVRVDATKSGAPVVVTLARGAYVRVRVVDADGRATTCDEFEASSPVDPDADFHLSEQMAGTHVGRLPAGRWRFVATRGDVSVEATVELTEGATQDVTLRFAK